MEDVAAKEFLGSDGILLLTRPHSASDVVLVCTGEGGHRGCGPNWPSRPVEFHCHRAALARRCGLFAGMSTFEDLAGSVVAARIEVPARDDVVFEVLRYVYCGTVFLPFGFRKRFAEFLRVLDYLGIEDMVEMSRGGGSASSSIFAEPSVREFLRDVGPEYLSTMLRDDACGLTVGFSVRRALLAKVTELRSLQHQQRQQQLLAEAEAPRPADMHPAVVAERGDEHPAFAPRRSAGAGFLRAQLPLGDGRPFGGVGRWDGSSGPSTVLQVLNVHGPGDLHRFGGSSPVGVY